MTFTEKFGITLAKSFVRAIKYLVMRLKKLITS